MVGATDGCNQTDNLAEQQEGKCEICGCEISSSDEDDEDDKEHKDASEEEQYENDWVKLTEDTKQEQEMVLDMCRKDIEF
jgi:hypothetical protein